LVEYVSLGKEVAAGTEKNFGRSRGGGVIRCMLMKRFSSVISGRSLDRKGKTLTD